jgi:hypothetical protein
MLHRDANHEIPAMFFAGNVAASCSEEGGGSYSRTHILGYLVAKSMIENRDLGPEH